MNNQHTEKKSEVEILESIKQAIIDADSGACATIVLNGNSIHMVAAGRAGTGKSHFIKHHRTQIRERLLSSK